MRFTALIGCVALLAACTKKEAPATDTTAMATPADTTTPAAAAVPPAAPVSLTSMSGKWNVTVKPAGKDTVLTTYVLNATDTAHWTFKFKSGQEVAMRVTGTSGDTVMTTTDWFKSEVMKGQKVKTDSKTWLQDGKLMGTVVAHYQKSGPDSVRMLTTEGVKQ